MLRFTYRAFMLLLLGLSIAWAQTQNAQIAGTVTDPSGARVVDAEVVVTNVSTSVARTVVTGATGNYSVPNLTPGVYTVEVSAAGFQQAVSDLISLDVNQSATFDVELRVGSVAETVEVTAEGVQLESSTAQLGTVVTEEKIQELPLNGRNFTQLLTLTTGASPVSVGLNRRGAQIQQVGTFAFPAINGQHNRSNDFTLDGVSNNGHFMGVYAIAPNVDALSQFKVQSHSDRAEFGGAAGGVVNIATKSGTNEFHGSVYHFLRNDKLDARGFFTAGKPALRQNQFGGTIGGRIVPNKTFFYFSYEGYRRSVGSSRLTRVPTPAELSGDFSAARRRIFDPFSTREDPADPRRLIRDPFPGGRIPGSLINASTAEWAQEVIPAPMNTGVSRFNHRNTDPQTGPSNQYNIRVDQHFSASDFLWFRATWGEQTRRSPQAIAGTSREIRTPAENVGASYTHIFGTNTVVTGLFGVAGLLQEDFYDPGGRDLSGLFQGTPPETKSPRISVPGAFGTIDSRVRQLGPQRTWQGRGDVSHVAGNHSFKFGGQVLRIIFQNIQTSAQQSYSTRQTGDLNALGSTGDDIASFVLGVPDFAVTRPSLEKIGIGHESQTWGLYFQDTWKATQKLTVNWGLRWDLLRNPSFFRNAPGVWDFNGSGKMLVGRPTPPSCADSGGSPPCLVDPNSPYIQQFVEFIGRPKVFTDVKTNFGPRLGFAYRALPNAVVRASIGIFFDLVNGTSQRAQTSTRWPDVTGVTRRAANRTFVEFTAEDPTGGVTNDLPPVTPQRTGGNFSDPKFKPAYSEQWNLDVQWELPDGTLLTTGYVGSHNVRLSIAPNFNTALLPGPGPIRDRQPWPHAPVVGYLRSAGQSWYNSLQVKAERRFADGFTYLLAYTWSKSIDTGASGYFNESVSITNPYDPNASKSVSGFDVPHVFSFAGVYELPFGQGKRWLNTGLASRIFGNWQFNGIVTLRNGQPFTPIMNLDIANIGAINQWSRARPDLVGDPKLSNPTPERWFNTDEFASPAQFTFGTAGRNIVRTDASQNVDLSLFREDQITERLRLQFRAEFFNAFNHPSFGIPQSGFTNRRFGQVSSTVSTARQIQFGLKLIF